MPAHRCLIAAVIIVLMAALVFFLITFFTPVQGVFGTADSVLQLYLNVSGDIPEEQCTASQADFGPRPPPETTLTGRIRLAVPLLACTEIERARSPSDIVVIKRGGECRFENKVFNAEKAGYQAAVIYNDKDNTLYRMSGGGLPINITSFFIGLSCGTDIVERNLANRGYAKIILFDGDPWNLREFLWPFLICFSFCFLALLLYSVYRCARDYRRTRRSRLSKSHLKKLPIKRYKTDDPYDTCAVCMDDYVAGDKLRLLPCEHAYHMKCIDPWLLKNKRICPICRRKVFPKRRKRIRRRPDRAAPHSHVDPLSSAHNSTATTSDGRQRTITDASSVAEADRTSSDDRSSESDSESDAPDGPDGSDGLAAASPSINVSGRFHNQNERTPLLSEAGPSRRGAGQRQVVGQHQVAEPSTSRRPFGTSYGTDGAGYESIDGQTIVPVPDDDDDDDDDGGGDAAGQEDGAPVERQTSAPFSTAWRNLKGKLQNRMRRLRGGQSLDEEPLVGTTASSGAESSRPSSSSSSSSQVPARSLSVDDGDNTNGPRQSALIV